MFKQKSLSLISILLINAFILNNFAYSSVVVSRQLYSRKYDINCDKLRVPLIFSAGSSSETRENDLKAMLLSSKDSLLEMNEPGMLYIQRTIAEVMQKHALISPHTKQVFMLFQLLAHLEYEGIKLESSELQSSFRESKVNNKSNILEELQAISDFLNRANNANERVSNEDIVFLFKELGDYCTQEKNYAAASSQYFHLLCCDRRNAESCSLLLSSLNKLHSAIPEEAIQEFRRYWERQDVNIGTLWKVIQGITEMRELRFIQAETDEAWWEGKDRFEQVVKTVEALEYLDDAVEGHIGESGLLTYFNGRKNQAQDLDRQAMGNIVMHYDAIRHDKLNTKLYKIVWLAAILKDYSRILQGDDSKNAQEIIPSLLDRLGLEKGEIELIMALAYFHRDFRTLQLGDGSVAAIIDYLQHLSEITPSKMKGNEGSGQAKQIEAAEEVNENMFTFDNMYDELKALQRDGRLYQLFPDLEKLQLVEKYKGVSILEHSLQFVQFMEIFERRDYKVFEQNRNRAFDPISQEKFNRFCDAFEELINYKADGDKRIIQKNRRLLYYIALFHDIASWPTSIGHDARGADMIKGLLVRVGFDNEDIERAAFFIKYHVELGTNFYGERRAANLLEETQYFNESRKKDAFFGLVFITACDILATSGGGYLNAERIKFFIRILDDPYYLKQLDNEFDLHRLEMFSAFPNGPVHDAKYEVALGEYRRLANYLGIEGPERCKKYLGNELKVLDYGVFFLKSLKAESMVKFLILLTCLSKANGTPIERVNFTAPSSMAAFSKQPIEEFLEQITDDQLKSWFRDGVRFEKIAKELRERGLFIRYDSEKEITIDNKFAIMLPMYLRAASILSFTYYAGRGGKGTLTDIICRNCAVLSQISSFKDIMRLNESWLLVRFFKGFRAKGDLRQLIDLQSSVARLYEGLKDEEKDLQSVARRYGEYKLEAELGKVREEKPDWELFNECIYRWFFIKAAYTLRPLHDEGLVRMLYGLTHFAKIAGPEKINTVIFDPQPNPSDPNIITLKEHLDKNVTIDKIRKTENLTQLSRLLGFEEDGIIIINSDTILVDLRKIRGAHYKIQLNPEVIGSAI